MTFGNREFPSFQHPFLRQATGPKPAQPLTRSRSEPRSAMDGPASDEKLPDTDAIHAVRHELEKWNRYCALAIHIDNANPHKVSQSLDKLLMQFIGSAQMTHGAVSCRWKERLYFCALPDVDMTAACQFSKELQATVALQRPETISIGIAPYPLLDYTKRQNWANAYKALEHAALIGPGSIVGLDAVTLNISGDQYYQAGEMDKAVSEYSAALALDPGEANVRNSLGVCFAEMNDTTAAWEAFEIVTDIDPKEPMAHYNKGMLCLIENRVESALRHFRESYGLKNDYYEIPFQIAGILCEQCRWEEALAYLEKAVALRRDHGGVHCLTGLCLAAMDKIPESIKAYTCAVKINPNNAEALSALGCLYDMQNENADISRTFLEQSVALAPENGLFHHRLGRWHQKRKQYDQAVASYQKANQWGHDSTRQIAQIQTQMQKETHHGTCRAG